jgi:peptidoglycan/xylan/chitin deacetylase (PgdA/CDA1 family)
MPQTKKWISMITNNSFSGHLMGMLERLQSERPNQLRVLTYHQVEEINNFDEQMSYLADEFEVVSMERVMEAVLGGEPLPPRSVLITFDDAYRNFAECAWPILVQYNHPVTMFVPTGFPDQPERVFWWDRLNFAFQHTNRRDTIQTPVGEVSLATGPQRHQAYLRVKKHLRFLPNSEIMAWTYQLCLTLDTPQPESQVMGWEELRQLARQGVTLAAHSQTHLLMDRLTVKGAEEEAVGSLRDLEREIGQTLPVFAYPGGRYGDNTIQALQQGGFVLAFTTVRGVNELGRADPFQLRRINIGSRATQAVLRARLLHASWYLNQLRPLPN